MSDSKLCSVAVLRNSMSIADVVDAFAVCKAVTALATFSARIVIYLMLIRCAGT